MTFYRHLLPEVVRQGVDVTVLVGSSVSQPGGQARIDGVKVAGPERAGFGRRLQEFGHLEAMAEIDRPPAAAWPYAIPPGRSTHYPNASPRFRWLCRVSPHLALSAGEYAVRWFKPHLRAGRRSA